jgi:Arc/MetJ-type ribon-helix-helix transcriptional regulator
MGRAKRAKPQISVSLSPELKRRLQAIVDAGETFTLAHLVREIIREAEAAETPIFQRWRQRNERDD